MSNVPAVPAGLRQRFSYDEVINQLKAAAPGEWVQLDPAAIDGVHHGTKQARLHQAARQRGLKVTTVFRLPADRLYARLIEDVTEVTESLTIPSLAAAGLAAPR
jgi:hypothetical protein